MLALIRALTMSSTKGFSMLAVSRSATRPRLFDVGADQETTANSSPPNRTTTSELADHRREARSELPQELRHRPVPERVVDLLEVIQVDEQERQVLARSEDSDRLALEEISNTLMSLRLFPSPVSSSVTASLWRSSVIERSATRTRSPAGPRRARASPSRNTHRHPGRPVEVATKSTPSPAAVAIPGRRNPLVFSATRRPVCFGRSHTAMEMRRIAVGHAIALKALPIRADPTGTRRG